MIDAIKFCVQQQKQINLMLKVPNNPSSFKPQHTNQQQSKQQDSIISKRETKSNSDNKSRLMDILADVMKTIMNEHGKFQNEELKKDDGSVGDKNPDFKGQGEEGAGQSKKAQVISISNKATIQKSKYGEQYKNNLDPRDRLLSHPFQFLLEIPQIQNLEGSFTKSKVYTKLCDKIQEYLVDVVENVVSASFNLLIEGKLKQNQSKDYASKNILMNVYSIFKEVMGTLTDEQIINKKETKKLRFALIQLVDSTLNQILSNLAPYYPQAPPTGGTPRMRDALLSIDRNSNEELDFLYTQKLKLRESDDDDYTGFIMTVINRAIQATGQIDHKDPLRQTLFQKFVAFSQNLFWLAQQDSYEDVIGSMEQQNEQNDKDAEQGDQGGEKQLRKALLEEPQSLQAPESNNSWGFFKSCNKTPPEINIKKKGKEVTDKIAKKQISQFLRKPIFADSSKAFLAKVSESNKQKKIESMKATHEFQIGQKIPGSVKSFSKKDIIDKKFSAKHSAVLRMLTKWAQNLQNIFDNPEVYTLNRTYPFKTLNHQIIFPKKQLKENLYKNLKEKKAQKQKIKNYLITRNKVFQSTFFSKDNTQNISKLIKRYTETRMMASKINALLIQFMKEYVSQLIKLLVDAGKTKIQFKQGQYVIQKEYEINLVVFKIGDLMRSKIHCSEASFIRLLKTLYILQEVDTNGEKSLAGEKIKKDPVFELVRIKNKLDTKDNNILINYLFMGKIQCELQMSVQKIAGKQMNYYMFSHFLYELTRGTFGVLSECATIIAQHDPIVSSSSASLYYEPKKQKKKVQIEIKPQIQQNQRDSLQVTNVRKKKEGKKGSKMFVCEKCENLKFEQNLDLMQRQSHENQICNECLFGMVVPDMLEAVLFNKSAQFKSEQKLSDKQMSQWIIQNLKKSHIQKLQNYQQLVSKKDENITYIIFSLNHKKIELQFSIFNYQQSENIFFLSRITKEILQKQNKKQKDVEYEDINGLIKKGVKFPEYTYIMPIKDEQACKDVLSRIKFIKSQHVVDKLKDISKKCRDKILRDSILNILRNRNQTLEFNSNDQKLRKMKELVEEGQMKDSKTKDSKYKWVEESLANIQFIFAEKTNMGKLPAWLGLCKKMQLINLSGNSIKNVSALQDMTEITEIILHENEIGDMNWKKLINLERLNLSNNKLKDFDMKTLPPSLEEIDLGHNALKVLNLQNLSRYLPKLKKLDAFGNDINTIDFRSLPSTVQHIDVSFNFLKTVENTKLPAALQVLYLNHNELTSFHVQDLHFLHELVLSENKLTKFTIHDCPSLKELYLDQNLLMKLQLNDFPVLLEVNIGENPNLNQLILKNLPCIHLINMGQINVKKLKEVEIDHLGHDGVQITQNPEMIKYLKDKYPKIDFYDQQGSNQNGYSLNDSEQQYAHRGGV